MRRKLKRIFWKSTHFLHVKESGEEVAEERELWRPLKTKIERERERDRG